MHHHERWDGEGYPFGLKGEKIPLSGRITAMADVFDAVVSHRCYKEAYSLEIALDIIEKDTGKHFDPAVVRAFTGILDEVLKIYPALGETQTASVETPVPRTRLDPSGAK